MRRLALYRGYLRQNEVVSAETSGHSPKQKYSASNIEVDVFSGMPLLEELEIRRAKHFISRNGHLLQSKVENARFHQKKLKS